MSWVVLESLTLLAYAVPNPLAGEVVFAFEAFTKGHEEPLLSRDCKISSKIFLTFTCSSAL